MAKVYLGTRGFRLLVCGLFAGGLASSAGDFTTGAVSARQAIDRGRYAEAVVLARASLAGQPADTLGTADASELLVEALYLAGEGGKPEATALIENAIATRQRLAGPNDPALARTLNLAATLKLGEDTEAARLLLERALAIGERALGSREAEVGSSCHLLGELYALRWDFRPAESWYSRALAIRKRVLGADHPDTLLSLARRDWVVVNGDLDDPGRWEREVPAAVERAERILGPAHPRLAELLRTLALCQGQGSEPDGVRVSMERVAAIDEKALGTDHPVYAADLLTLPADDAVPNIERALAILEKAYGTDSPRLGPALEYLGWAMVGRRDLERARDLLERATAYATRVYSPQAPRMAHTLILLGTAYRERGDYALARTMIERALAVAEKTAPAESMIVAEVQIYLGELLTHTRDCSAAKAYLERAVATVEKLRGPCNESLPLASLGEALRCLKDNEGAKALLQRSVAIIERLHGPDFPLIAYTLTGLARVQIEIGELAQARPLVERALGIAERAYGKDGIATLLAVRTMCALDLADERYAAAVASCERALAGSKARWGPTHPSIAVRGGLVAAALFGRGDRRAAIERALAAEEVGRNHFLKTARSFAEREALRYGAARHSPLDVALSIVASGPDPEEVPDAVLRVWDQVARSRAMVLDEMASRHQALRARGTAAAELYERVAAARAEVNRILMGQTGGGAEGLARASEAVDAAERALAEKSVTFRRRENLTRVGLDEVLRAMPPRSALVAYAKYNRMQPAVPGERRSFYLAFVWNGGGAGPAAVDLGPAEAIERLVGDWRRQILVPVGSTGPLPPDAEAAYTEAGGALRRAIWDPVLRFVDGSELALIVPDGPLSLVNFETLPAAAGGYLIESGPKLHLLSAERDVVDAARPGAAGRGLLLVGGVAFDGAPGKSPAPAAEYRGAAPTCTGFRSMRFTALPRSLLEVDEVRSLWNPKEPVVRLVGEAASEGAVKRLMPGERVVHLATHGFFYGPECLGDRGSAADNELSLAGLALAGANRREEAAPDAEDGVLTADEISALDLTRSDWVVLSACDSGTGQVLDGEGVSGLRRSFQIAGARTLIMSLWPVQDEMARQWMRRVYQARAGGASTVAAVSGAGLDLLATRRKLGLNTHPFYWGSFVAAGGWR